MYADLVAELKKRGWNVFTRPIKVEVRGFVKRSVTRLLVDLGFRGGVLTEIVKEEEGMAY